MHAASVLEYAQEWALMKNESAVILVGAELCSIAGIGHAMALTALYLLGGWSEGFLRGLLCSVIQNGNLQAGFGNESAEIIPQARLWWYGAADLYLGSSVRDTAISLVATTSTEIFCCLKMSNIWARNPNWPSMRVLTMSIRVTSPFSTMLVISAWLMSRVLEMSVPAACLHSAWNLSPRYQGLRKLFLTFAEKLIKFPAKTRLSLLKRHRNGWHLKPLKRHRSISTS